MVTFFKEVLLPYLVLITVLLATLIGLFKNPKAPLLLMAFLVSLPNVWYPAQALPMGRQTMDFLTFSGLLGLLLTRQGVERAPKQGLFLVLFFISYMATWIVSFKYDLPWPVTLDNPVLADWKNYILMMLLYFAAFNIMRTEKDVKTLINVMMAVVFLIIVQNYRSVLAGETYSQTTRAAGPFTVVGLNPNHFGAFLANYCVAALALYFMEDQNRWLKRIYLFIFVGGIYPIFYTYSRGAYLAMVMGLVVIGLLRFRPILGGILLLAITWETVLPESVVARIQMTSGESGELEESAALRLVVWDLAKQLFAENPIFGIGFNGFVFASKDMRLHNTHNFYLQTAAEQGVVGCLVLGAVMVRSLLSGWRLYRCKASGFARGAGLGFLSCTVVVLVTNIFGDRFSQLALGGFFFLFMGAVDRLLVIYSRPPAEAPAGGTAATPHAAQRSLA